ncbi:F-box protein interaction domain protein [Quillaja saponaria]|uniref:F-box protein interaction domain protein n=1 Tax=Quillaja saponaria TaxID=32244 RepID=A0AAD7QF66_QUISA|nr:F-box protein interaction domain protein [Quillaja saponaria]
MGERMFTVYGFDYDNFIDDYKVVAISSYPNGENSYKNKVKVYTMRSNCWRRIQEFPFSEPYNESATFVSGVLIWTAFYSNGSSYKRSIISLDLGKETYKEVFQPLDCRQALDFRPTFGVLRDCLCIMYNVSVRQIQLCG